MMRLIAYGSALCILMAAPPAATFARANPNGKGVNANAPSGESKADPRLRRARREEAVATVGPIARDFVETQGDEAVAAIFACSKPVAAKLAEFHASGELNKLPRPRDLLRVIAQWGNGDDVVLWAIGHANELTDTDGFDAYLHSPLDYALGLKPLAAGAAEVRASRLSKAAAVESPPAPPPATVLTLPAISANDWNLIEGVGAIVGGIVLLLLLRRFTRRQGV